MLKIIKTNSFLILKKQNHSMILNYKHKKDFQSLIYESLIKKNSIVFDKHFKINRIDDLNYLITELKSLKQMLVSNLDLIKIL